ncbi:fatty acyl-CoA reductase wat-like [Epargyreus clarus]|uniref:fatty acyl-CoA reductase wat-like n=1 Tax=Epargyreus clarus TaxID=520877 RepID=UPI003C2BD391
MDPALAVETAFKAKHRNIEEALLRGDSDVAKLYDDATIFITGGSGFLGKQLIEKLIRSCNVRKIYVLLRPKKGKPAQVRLHEILSDPVYDPLKKLYPNFTDKIIPIDGDVRELKMDLSEDDWKTITEEVNVIFHMAATVNFQEDVRTATITNVRGTREMMLLARACRQLKSMVHVSTAYSHATKHRINKAVREDFYEAPIAPEDMITLAENNEIDYLNDILKSRGSDWPNTYTFTKAVAEETVRTMAADLPVCVVRPAIVIGAYREPSPGWVDSNQVLGASGLVLGSILGMIHVIRGDTNNRMDFIPVDVVTNVLVAAGWDTARIHGQSGRQTKIYNVTSNRNHFTMGQLVLTLDTQAREFISPKTVWYGFTNLAKHKFVYIILNWLLHYIPASIVDCALYITGKKLRLLKIYKKINNLGSVLSYFGLNEWLFEDGNTLGLYNSLSTTDKVLFNCDMSLVDNKELIVMWILGLRRYIVKDDLKNTEYGRKKQLLFRIAHYIFMTLYLYLIYKLICFVFSIIGFF